MQKYDFYLKRQVIYKINTELMPIISIIPKLILEMPIILIMPEISIINFGSGKSGNEEMRKLEN